MARKYEGLPKAHLIDKNEFGTAWKEVIIRWGSLEILVIGGYSGEISSSTRKAFLGSALPKSIADLFTETEFSIFVPLQHLESIASVWHLRDYSKRASGKLWSYESKGFSVEKFRVCHPLAIDQHSTWWNKKEPDAASVASFVLSLAAKKTYSVDGRQKALGLLARTKDVKKLRMQDGSQPFFQSLSIVSKLLKEQNPKSRLHCPLSLLWTLDQHLGTLETVILLTVY